MTQSPNVQFVQRRVMEAKIVKQNVKENWSRSWGKEWKRYNDLDIDLDVGEHDTKEENNFLLYS